MVNVEIPTLATQYIRRSDDQQEYSLDQQREINDQYCAQNGYVLAPGQERFIETGSGRSFENRPIFQAMLRLVESGQAKFRRIIMYRTNRFGRADDPTEFFFYEYRLRKCGVTIEYAMNPECNAENTAGRIMRLLEFEKAGAYSRDLSTDVCRGMLDRGKRGERLGGNPPFGFSRGLFDKAGNFEMELQPGFRNPKGGSVVKLIHGDPKLVAFVREHIFHRPYYDGYGPRGVSNRLNEMLDRGEGYPPQRMGWQYRRKSGLVQVCSGRWHASVIQAIWTNIAYIGWQRTVINANNAFQGQEVVCKNAHEPMIEEEIFWELYGRYKKLPWNLGRKAARENRLKGQHYRTRTDYLVSGLGVCADCGERFHGCPSSRRKKRRDGTIISGKNYYYRDRGELLKVCRIPRWSVPKEWIEQKIIGHVLERVRSGAYREEIRRQLQAMKADEASTALKRSLESEGAKLTEIQIAKRNLLEHLKKGKAQESILDELQALEDQQKEQANRVQAVRDRIEQSTRLINVDALAQLIEEEAEKLITANIERRKQAVAFFLRQFEVDKQRRCVTGEFYCDPAAGTRDFFLEAAGVEPASEELWNSRLRA